MSEWRIPIWRVVIIGTVVALFVVSLSAQVSQPSPMKKGHACSIATIAGKWMFATEIGMFPGGIHATALGTYNIGTDGSLSGVFDYNGEDTVETKITYWGTVTVNPDCTGTESFTGADGGSALVSFVIARGGQEIWGQFMNNVSNIGYTVIWTFKAHRVDTDD